jgi:ribonuclease BN (tRNA processing enzyme)
MASEVPGGRETTLRFIGVGNCMPEPGGETACVLLNGDVLVDAGWCAALHMRRFGCDPLALRYVFITHCHHDHYIGMAPLLFYRAMRGLEGAAPPLTIVGPRTEIRRVVDDAARFLQADRYGDANSPVEVVCLRAEHEFEAGDFHVRAMQVVHPVPALCYRFESHATGASVVVTGDTGPYAPLAQFAAGADVLVHEASLATGQGDPQKPWGHSGAADAARVARDAGVGRLCLVHCSASERQAALEAARAIFPQSYAPEEGETIADFGLRKAD